MAGALAEDVTRLADRTGLAVDLDVTDYDGTLPPEAELQVFRISQAAFANVERHAGANSVTVTLMTDPGDPDDSTESRASTVVLEISDDGVGIGADAAARVGAFRPQVGLGLGIGLEIMHHRAGMVGGDLTVARIGPDGGTRARLVVPVPTADAGGGTAA